MRKLFLVVLVAFIGCFILTQTSFAATLAYEWIPGQESGLESRSVVFEQFLADDFIPIISGFVVRVDWWGAFTFRGDWQLTFYNDEGAASPMFPFLSQQMPSDILGVLDVNGTWMYSAVWNSQDLFINAWTPYWFSPASFDPMWTWATPGAGPTVGFSPDHAEKSWFPPGELPWVPADHPNYAFRVYVEDPSVIPIPGAIYLLGSGLVGLVGFRKKLKGYLSG